jgi:peptidyl-prolyl cis-trans isomerase SurA
MQIKAIISQLIKSAGQLIPAAVFRSRVRCLLLAGLMLAGAVYPATGTKRELVDRVVAVVENDAIFQSDIDRTVSQFMIDQGQTSMPDSARVRLKGQILNSLISDKLIVAQAGKLEITVSFEEVEETVRRTIAEKQELLGGEAAFDRQLALENMTMDDLKKLYREQVRNRMLVDRVLAAEIDRRTLRISEEELQAHYQERMAELPARPEVVHLKTLILAFQSSDNARLAAREKIDAVYARLQAGEDFADLARQASEDPSAPAGGDLGFVNLADLRDPAFVEVAGRLEVGAVSEPVLTSFGYHIIKLVEKAPTGSDVHLRHIMVRIQAGEGDIKQVYDKATAIHARLVAGESFDSLAVRYSDDPATADNGGDLGWLKVEDLPTFFLDVLQAMKPGEISQILRESAGFRIVQLLEREVERPYDFEEVKNEIKRSLETEKLASSYDTYIRTLRDKFYVRIHRAP